MRDVVMCRPVRGFWYLPETCSAFISLLRLERARLRKKQNHQQCTGKTESSLYLLSWWYCQSRVFPLLENELKSNPGDFTAVISSLKNSSPPCRSENYCLWDCDDYYSIGTLQSSPFGFTLDSRLCLSRHRRRNKRLRIPLALQKAVMLSWRQKAVMLSSLSVIEVGTP